MVSCSRAALLQKRGARLLREHGLTDAQFNVLMLLHHQGERGRMSQIRLGRLLLVNRSNVTGLVDRMERDGLVRREDDPDDRRVNLVAITEKGMEVLGGAMAAYYPMLDEGNGRCERAGAQGADGVAGKGAAKDQVKELRRFFCGYGSYINKTILTCTGNHRINGGAMFISLLAVTFAVSLGVSLVVSSLFSGSIRKILDRIIQEDISAGWLKYIRFAIVVVGVSAGVRIHALERYILPDQNARAVEDGAKAVAAAIPELNMDRWVLEVYRTVIETAAGVAWLLLVFFHFRPYRLRYHPGHGVEAREISVA